LFLIVSAEVLSVYVYLLAYYSISLVGMFTPILRHLAVVTLIFRDASCV